MAVPKHKRIRSTKKVKTHFYLKNKLRTRKLSLKKFESFSTSKVKNICSYCNSAAHLVKNICVQCVYENEFSYHLKDLKKGTSTILKK